MAVEGFTAASGFLLEAVRLIPDNAWDSPGLGEWSVRELVAHAHRGQTTVEEYLLNPQQPADGDYFSAAAVAERGRRAVAALGADPAGTIATRSGQIIALIRRTPADTAIAGPAGAMPLATYLPSRTAELTIHTLDIAAALGIELSAPEAALAESLRFVTLLGMRHGRGTPVLLALSGRAPLPAEFSVYAGPR